MSLKWFHLVFISLSVVVSVGFGFWGIFNGYVLLGTLSFIVAAALIVYGNYFLQKVRELI